MHAYVVQGGTWPWEAETRDQLQTRGLLPLPTGDGGRVNLVAIGCVVCRSLPPLLLSSFLTTPPFPDTSPCFSPSICLLLKFSGLLLRQLPAPLAPPIECEFQESKEQACLVRGHSFSESTEKDAPGAVHGGVCSLRPVPPGPRQRPHSW